MKNINDYKICKAIVSLENEVDMLKNKIGSELPDGSIDLSDYVTNDGLATKLENYYTIEEADDNFVINDYENELSFTDGGIISNGQWRSVCYGKVCKAPRAKPHGMFVAVGFDSKCAWSTDGKTFTEGTSSDSAWFSVCYGNGMFVTITNGNSKCAWSTDGKTFTDGTIGDGYWYNVCYGNGMFVASGYDECAWSSDGKTFTKGTIGTGSWRSVCYGNGIFVTISYSKCAWSSDGKTFTEGTISTGSWYSVCYGNGMFVAVNNDGKCAWSTDGKTFTEGTISDGQWQNVCYGNGLFVVVSYISKCAWSTDGKTFIDGTISDNYWYNVCYGNGVFVASGSDECVWSTDGKTFTKGTIGTGSWRSVCYGNGIFVTVSYSKSAWSTDGKTFTDGTIGTGSWYSVCYGNGMFVAVSKDKCAWSTDGKTFTNGTIDRGLWSSVCYGNGMFVTISRNGNSCTWSTDGKTFTYETINTSSWSSVCYGNGMFVAVNNYGRCVWSEFRIVTAKSFALKEETYTKTESDELYTLKTELQQSMTITHLAPIDEELNINSFVIGAPVYMTGNVYVKDWENNTWNKSTINDFIDCISSVKTNGTWKEYLGICTHVLSESEENGTESLSRNCGEIRFATHGDYLVKVSDSSKFNIGDTIYIDFGENSSEIKILTEDISLNTKIQRTTIGIITSILDETTVSVFKA